jgi:hypothetical protein
MHQAQLRISQPGVTGLELTGEDPGQLEASG